MATFELPIKTKVHNTPRRVPSRPDKSTPTLAFPEKALPVQIYPEGISSPQLNSSYNRSLGQSYVNQCFRDVSLLGEGSYGKVYKAFSRQDNKWYAIKRFKTPYRNLSDRRIRLLEVQQYGRVPQNENCVELKSAWEESGQLYLQMELCSLTLDQYILHNKFEENDMWKILHDVLLGLKNLHDNEFIHLDIKPENILVTENKVFKLGDFGLLMDLSQGPVKDGDEGDAKYLAAEILSGSYTKAADIFSLGISMLEIAANVELPTSGDNWHRLRKGILPRFQMSHMSVDLCQVIENMMLPTYTDRPTIEQLLQHERICKLEHSTPLKILCGMNILKYWYSFGTSIAFNILKPVIPFLPSLILRRFQPYNSEIGANSTSLENLQNVTPTKSTRETSVFTPSCRRRIFADDTILQNGGSDDSDTSQGKVSNRRMETAIELRRKSIKRALSERSTHELQSTSREGEIDNVGTLETAIKAIPKRIRLSYAARSAYELQSTSQEGRTDNVRTLETATKATPKRIRLSYSVRRLRRVQTSTSKRRVGRI